MKPRYLQLVSEAMTVIPMWEDGIGKLMINSSPRIAGEGQTIEEFPAATPAEYRECCDLLRSSMERAAEEIKRRRGQG